MVPVELSVKVTIKGHGPLVGLPVKAASGTCAPVPVAALVWLGPLLVRNERRLLKLPVLVGLKLTRTLVELWAGRAKPVVDRIRNGPVPTETETFVSPMLPRFVATKLP